MKKRKVRYALLEESRKRWEEEDKRIKEMRERFEMERLEREKEREEEEARLKAERLARKKEREEEEARLKAERLVRQKKREEEEARQKAEHLARKKEREEEEKKFEAKYSAWFAKIWKMCEANAQEIGGISRSNGEFAEEHFFNAMEKKMALGQVHFDSIGNLKRKLSNHNGQPLEGQFDIVMLNGEACAIIEVKYKMRKDDIEKFITKDLEKFRILFPDYAKLKTYLGIGAMTFDDGSLEKAKQLGIAILKQKGDVIEFVNENLKEY